MISGEEVLELLPALARARADERLPVLRLPDRRRPPRADRARRGRALRRGLRQPPRRHRAARADGRAGGVRVRDLESGGEFEVRAANVVNATGVWADELRPQELHDEAELPRDPPEPRHARDAAQADLPLIGGAIVPAGGGPLDLRAAVARPHARGDHRQRLRGPARRTSSPRTRTSTTCSMRSTRSSARRSGRADLTGAFAGVRPLISTGDPKKSVDISRKAELYETSSGMITITGGKLTTWRRMAKMTVDRIVERDARDAPCRTHEIPLGQAIALEELPRVEGVPEESYAALAGALRARRARGARAGRRARGARPADRRRGCPTCSPRPCSPRAASRHGASATCCCGAPASACSPRAS